MSSDLDCDVLIAGAGPTGMSAAIALHDAGYRVIIIDKHAKGLAFSRAILVNSQTLSLLKPLGVADKIMAQGQRFRSITIQGVDGTLLEGHVGDSTDSEIRPTLLPQLTTEQCLLEGLLERGIRVNRPAELKTLHQFETHVESLVNFGEEIQTIRSSYLLGADGAHSAVRQSLGIDYHRSKRPLLMYSQDAEMDWTGRSDVMIWVLETGAAIAIRMGPRKIRFAATSKATFQALGLEDQIEKTTWESEFDVYFAQVKSYGDRRVWLAGDAAHVHSPIGGRGMNMGIADGVRFAKGLLDGDLSGYQRDRHAVSAGWVRKNQRLTELMTDTTFKGRLARAGVRSLFKVVARVAGANAGKKIFEAIAVG